MTGTARPAWSRQDIARSGLRVRQLLTEKSPFGRKLDSAQRRCGGAGYWAQQFDIMKRSACAAESNINRNIDILANDAPRVTGLVSQQWDRFFSQVPIAYRDEYIREAARGAGAFYFFLVTDVVHRPWYRLNPGMEASAATAWRKLPPDLRFLWNAERFSRVLLWQ